MLEFQSSFLKVASKNTSGGSQSVIVTSEDRRWMARIIYTSGANLYEKLDLLKRVGATGVWKRKGQDNQLLVDIASSHTRYSEWPPELRRVPAVEIADEDLHSDQYELVCFARQQANRA